MGIYDKLTDEMVDFHIYNSLQEAVSNLLFTKIPKGLYGKIESDAFIGVIKTVQEAEQMLKARQFITEEK